MGIETCKFWIISGCKTQTGFWVEMEDWRWWFMFRMFKSGGRCGLGVSEWISFQINGGGNWVSLVLSGYS